MLQIKNNSEAALEAMRLELQDANKAVASVSLFETELGRAQHTIMTLTNEIRSKTITADEARHALGKDLEQLRQHYACELEKQATLFADQAQEDMKVHKAQIAELRAGMEDASAHADAARQQLENVRSAAAEEITGIKQRSEEVNLRLERARAAAVGEMKAMRQQFEEEYMRLNRQLDESEALEATSIKDRAQYESLVSALTKEAADAVFERDTTRQQVEDLSFKLDMLCRKQRCTVSACVQVSLVDDAITSELEAQGAEIEAQKSTIAGLQAKAHACEEEVAVLRRKLTQTVGRGAQMQDAATNVNFGFDKPTHDLSAGIHQHKPVGTQAAPRLTRDELTVPVTKSTLKPASGWELPSKHVLEDGRASKRVRHVVHAYTSWVRSLNSVSASHSLLAHMQCKPDFGHQGMSKPDSKHGTQQEPEIVSTELTAPGANQSILLQPAPQNDTAQHRASHSLHLSKIPVTAEVISPTGKKVLEDTRPTNFKMSQRCGTKATGPQPTNSNASGAASGKRSSRLTMMNSAQPSALLHVPKPDLPSQAVRRLPGGNKVCSMRPPHRRWLSLPCALEKYC
eukprot:365052-Chlamydomonas_euryale.AAC.39